ncbi:MAG: hypothetical protein ACRC46_15190 [Thermoguttaceae bacterium]
MKLISRSIFVGFLLVAVALTAFADDYRFPTRRAALGETSVPNNASSVADVIRGQTPATATSSMPSMTTTSTPAIGQVDKTPPRSDIVDSELSMRPPDPVGPVDPTTIPETLRSPPPISEPAGSQEKSHAGTDTRDDTTASATPSSAWNTLLLIVALVAGGLAAYAIFAALDYKQRWEHAILAQNDRLLGTFEGDDPIAMPQAW